MWSSGPASHGQFSGNGCREQVMTRQPAAEKRLTVAWPMPRLAPVRRSVRRGWLLVGIFYLLAIKDKAGLWSTARSSSHVERQCDRAGETAALARTRSRWGRRDSPTNSAA